MKKIVALMMAVLTALVMLCGCSEAEKASYNIAKQADYFESERKITVYNARTDTIVMEAEGYIPVITGDPEAGWVGETEKKPVKRGTLATKQMSPYTLAVIVPFSNQFRRDVPALYDQLVQRLPGALAKKFDQTVFGGDAPGSNFDTLKACTAQSILTNAYGGLVAADADIAAHDGILNGWVLAPQGKAILLNAVDGNKRPLFINSVAEGAVPMILGAQVRQSKGAYTANTASDAAVVGFAGDWSQAVYGTVEGVQIAISDQATLTDGSTTINLFEQNMFAVRAEIEVGFRCDTTVFNKLTGAAKTGS